LCFNSLAAQRRACIFPASREFGFRDEFAQDCLLQRGVRCEPEPGAAEIGSGENDVGGDDADADLSGTVDDPVFPVDRVGAWQQMAKGLPPQNIRSGGGGEFVSRVGLAALEPLSSERATEPGDAIAHPPLSEETDPARPSAACACPESVRRPDIATLRMRREPVGPQIQTDDELLDYAGRNGGPGGRL
jgi:hypothetical protein